jgi:hypothetical protein
MSWLDMALGAIAVLLLLVVRRLYYAVLALSRLDNQLAKLGSLQELPKLLQ